MYLTCELNENGVFSRFRSCWCFILLMYCLLFFSTYQFETLSQVEFTFFAVITL